MKPNSCACYGSNDIHECYCNLKINNMEQVTAVEWLVKQLNEKIDFIPLDKWDMIRNIVHQAKEMEKEQIENAWIEGMKSNQNNFQGI